MVFLRAPQGATPPALDAAVGEQVGTLRIGEAASVSVPWIAEPGSHAFAARAEVLPDQRIEPRDVRIAIELMALGRPSPSPGCTLETTR